MSFFPSFCRFCVVQNNTNTNGGGGRRRKRRPYSLPFVATKKEHHHPNSSTTARFCRAQNLLLSRAFLLEREREKNDAFGVWKEIGDEIKTAGSFLTSWRLRHHRRRRRRSRSEKARSRDERWSPTHPRGG